MKYLHLQIVNDPFRMILSRFGNYMFRDGRWITIFRFNVRNADSTLRGLAQTPQAV